MVESSYTQLQGVVQNGSGQKQPSVFTWKMIDQYSEVFKEGLGTFKCPKVKIQVEPEAHQSF